MDRILIVEDDPETAEAVAREVQALGSRDPACTI